MATLKSMLSLLLAIVWLLVLGRPPGLGAQEGSQAAEGAGVAGEVAAAQEAVAQQESQAAGQAAATEATDSDYGALFDEIPAAGSAFTLGLLGDHRAGFSVPLVKEDLDFSGPLKRPRFLNELGLEIQSREVKLLSRWALDLPMDESGDWNELLELKPRENYLAWTLGRLKISAGYQIFAWGSADRRNPTDNLNPRDFTAGLSGEKIPLLSLTGQAYPADFLSLAVVYVPFEQKDFFSGDPAEQIPAALFAGGIRAVEVREPRFAPRSFLLGSKLSLFLPAVDFSLSYLYDLDPFYTPVIHLSDTPPYLVKSIDLERRRIHRLGVDLKTTLDRFAFWLETCLSLTEDRVLDSYRLRNHRLAWIAGLDFSYGGREDYYVNLQYLGQWTANFYHRLYADYPQGLFDPGRLGDEAYMEAYFYRRLTDALGLEDAGLLQGLSLRLEWPLADSLLTPSITAAYFLPWLYDRERATEYGSLYLNPALDIMPGDDFHILLGAEAYLAWKQADGAVAIDREDLIGRLYDDSRIYLEMRYTWGYDLNR